MCKIESTHYFDENIMKQFRIFMLLFLCSNFIAGLVEAQGIFNVDGLKDKRKLELALKSISPYSGSMPIKIVATVGVISDILKHLGSERLEVETLVPNATDPHLYKPTEQNNATLAKANIIFQNGLALESGLTESLAIYCKKKPCFAVSELLNEKVLIRAGDLSTNFDPHVWMDLLLWKEVVEIMTSILKTFDPSYAELYEANSQRYTSQLTALHSYVRNVIGSIPRDQRTLVTAHDAFNYYGRAYEIAVRGVQGISTTSSPELRDINALIDFVIERKVQVVFSEKGVSPKNVETLIAGAKAREHSITSGGMLYADTLEQGSTKESSYLGVIAFDTDVIAKALGGIVPPNGFVSLEDIRRSHE
jgi:manganese/zinc/iron transport system substrate-binding protein